MMKYDRQDEKHIDKILIESEYNKFKYPTDIMNYDDFKIIINKTFISNSKFANLVTIIDKAKNQGHGTMIVFYQKEKIKGEVDRLKNASIQIEAIDFKYFGGLTRNKGIKTKSENAGSIVADLYRLANSAAGGKCRGLYSLVIFNQKPDKYLTFKRKDKTERIWLKKLLTPGTNSSMFSSKEEPSSIMKPFKGLNNVALSMVTRTLLFEPYSVNDGFWGYLIQLLDFSSNDDKRYNLGFK